MYLDMRKYGTDNFEFQILAEVESEKLKETEQKFIETLKPTYNDRNANGLDFERKKEYNKEYQKEYRKTDKCKDYQKEYQKEYQEEYKKTDKGKEIHKKSNKKYKNQLCCYNGETLTLNALQKRLKRMSILHLTLGGKKYLIQ